jgi:hypothetical protein
MIQRVVAIKLKSAYSNDNDRETVAWHSREVLGEIPEVVHIDVATPGDERCRSSWDLCLLVRFDDLDAVERYRADKRHRAYVDVFLKPMLEVIKVWNFELVLERPPEAEGAIRPPLPPGGEDRL